MAYRAIAPAVKDGHIHRHNEAIALLPENSEKVAVALAGLRSEVPPAEAKPAPATMVALKQRTEQVVAEYTELVAERWPRCRLPKDRS